MQTRKRRTIRGHCSRPKKKNLRTNESRHSCLSTRLCCLGQQSGHTERDRGERKNSCVFSPPQSLYARVAIDRAWRRLCVRVSHIRGNLMGYTYILRKGKRKRRDIYIMGFIFLVMRRASSIMDVYERDEGIFIVGYSAAQFVYSNLLILSGYLDGAFLLVYTCIL